MEFRLLGKLEIVGDSGPVPITAPKQRTLLAVLLLHPNEPVPADVLIDALWGERAPASARKLLQVYVSQLRKLLPTNHLRTTPAGYALAVESSEIDVAHFEQLFEEGRKALATANPNLALARLTEGLALWRGRALAEFAYEEFARAEAERLEQLRLAALEERAAAELALGRHEQVVAELRALLDQHPLRERLRAQAMLALYRCGRQAEALALFAEGRRLLRDELGLEPSDELRTLQAAILRHDASLDAGAAQAGVRTNVPAPVVELRGRERELGELSALVRQPDVRLVSVIGAGGSGKTSLALEVARAVVDDFANGAFVVELAALRESERVLAEIARVLGVEEAPGETLGETVGRWIHGRELLLLVDNAEHLPAAGQVLVELLGAGRGLTVLVTSRRVLHVSGERVYPLAPLPAAAAAELFVERARAAEPRFAPRPADAALVGEICARVDCLPLAIELAATHVRTLTIESLLERLARRLPLLAGGARDLPERQRTLRATVEWSHDLLSPAEQALFARLSVFAGSFDVAAAEEVCDADVETLSSLVERSLLHRSANGDLIMLETLREYAAERLDATGETDGLAGRHASYYLALAEDAEQRLYGDPEQAAWLERLEAAHTNLTGALAWAGAHDADAQLRLAAALARFWFLRGYLTEGSRALADALARGRDPHVRARAALGAGLLAHRRGAAADAQRLTEEALALFREVGDTRNVAHSLSRLANLASSTGEYERSIALNRQCIELYRGVGDDWGIAGATNSLALAALTIGDHDTAEAYAAESLELRRAIGDDTGTILSLCNLALSSLERGESARVPPLLEEALELSRRLGYREGTVFALGLAAAFAAGADAGRGARLLGAAESLGDTIGIRLVPAYRRLRDSTHASVRAELGEAGAAEALRQGAELDVVASEAAARDALTAHASAHATRPPVSRPVGI